AFLVGPLGWLVRLSFSNSYGGAATTAWVLDNYVEFLGDSWNLVNIIWFTIKVAVFSLVLSIIVSYPIAFYIARCKGTQRSILLTLILSPLLIGLVTLAYGWIVLFRGSGLINSLFIWLHVYDEPVR